MEVLSHPVKSSLAASPNAEVSEYRGALAAPHFAGMEQEFQGATTGCVVMDLAWKTRLRVAGGDAQRWLNGMVTNTAALEDGRGNYSFLLSAQGRLQGDAYLFRQGAEYVLETSADQQEKVLQWLDRYIIMDDVTLAPDSSLSATLAVTGPAAEAALATLGVNAAGLVPLAILDAVLAEISVKIVRDDTCCVPCFSIWHDAAHSQHVWQACVEAGAVEGGWQVQELLRIASGTPLFGVDLHERDLPQETGQQRALHFSKGCYIGQEIVERIHSRGNVHRGWRGFVFASPDALGQGAAIQADGKDIGTLTSVACLPLASGPQCVGLGIVRLQPILEQKELSAGGVVLQSADLPFLKNIHD